MNALYNKNEKFLVTGGCFRSLGGGWKPKNIHVLVLQVMMLCCTQA